jgi:hypothetical protein
VHIHRRILEAVRQTKHDRQSTIWFTSIREVPFRWNLTRRLSLWTCGPNGVIRKIPDGSLASISEITLSIHSREVGVIPENFGLLVHRARINFVTALKPKELGRERAQMPGCE